MKNERKVRRVADNDDDREIVQAQRGEGREWIGRGVAST